jgi:hypothetical protein
MGLKITVYHDPYLLDFLKAANELPQDEREQLEKLTGHPYSIDGCAIGNFQVPGPKWVAKLEDGTVLMVGGFAPERPGVWRDFLLSGKLAWSPDYAKQCTRICRRLMDAMLNSGQAHRLETIVPASRLAARPELERWYTLLGYNKEGTHYGYCADGGDAVSFSRVKH